MACGFDTADLVPASFRPVTRTLRLRAASFSDTKYVLSVAPGISAQLFPFAAQRSHWNENVIGCSPIQVPRFAVSRLPTVEPPEIEGSYSRAAPIG
jgi:hypothetical protein